MGSGWIVRSSHVSVQGHVVMVWGHVGIDGEMWVWGHVVNVCMGGGV